MPSSAQRLNSTRQTRRLSPSSLEGNNLASEVSTRDHPPGDQPGLGVNILTVQLVGPPCPVPVGAREQPVRTMAARPRNEMLFIGLQKVGSVGRCKAGTIDPMTEIDTTGLRPRCQPRRRESRGVPAGWPLTSARKVLWLTYR
jgi:hypothetical protein